MQQGKQEGKIEDAQKMLEKGISMALVQEITGLPLSQLKEIKLQSNA